MVRPSGAAKQREVPKEFKSMLEGFQDIMSKDHPSELPPTREVEHEIDFIPGSSIPNRPAYRYSPLEQEEVRRQIQELLDCGLIRESSSPCASPVLLAPKKDGTWRMCIDCKAVNKITIKCRYPLPRMDDIMDHLSGARFFSKIDLKSGYWQIRIREGDQWKTTFKTADGFYEWMVMPFGLSNAPTTFSRLMNQILKPFLGKSVIVYLDDILVFSKTYSEHVMHVRRVLETLREKRLQVNAEKSMYCQEELVYLGHIISEKGVRMDPEKIRAIVEWPRPKTVTEIRSFHGMVNVYRKYIRHFSEISAPLTRLIKKDKRFEWNSEAEKAFNELKRRMTTSPVLVLPDFRKVFEVQTDASGVAIGGVLLQENRPVAYFSEKLNDARQGYCTYDVELYAVVQALKNWRHYLLPKEFILETDHSALKYLQSQEKLQVRHAKWVSFLQEYSFIIKHRPGVENKVADALSRKRSLAAIKGVISRKKCLVGTLEVEVTDLVSIKALYEDDADFGSIFAKCLDPSVGERKELEDFFIQEGYLFKGKKMCILKCSLRTWLIRDIHCGGMGGHFGVEKSMELLERRYYWPTLKKDVKGFVDGCGACQRGKGKHQNTGLYMPLPVPKAPWEHISMDFIMGLPMTTRKKNAILVVVDRFSKMAHFVACAEQVNAVKCADLIYGEVVRLHGLPLSITSDRDGRFMSAFWRTLWKRVGTKLNFSSSFHPQTDGQTEVVNRSVGNMLRCLVGEKLGNWDLMLAQAEFAYNSSVNRSTGMSPFQIVYGRLPLFPADISFQAIEKESEEANHFVKDRA